MTKINKIVIFTLLYLGVLQHTYSQVNVSPLKYGNNTSKLTLTNQARLNSSDTLNLPFIEEFTVSKTLNQTNWIINKNVFI